VLARERAAVAALTQLPQVRPTGDQQTHSAAWDAAVAANQAAGLYAPASPPPTQRDRRSSLSVPPPFAVDDPALVPPPPPPGARPAPGGPFMSGLSELKGNTRSAEEAARREGTRLAYVAELNAQVEAKKAAKRQAKADEDAWERRHEAPASEEPARRLGRGAAPAGAAVWERSQAPNHAPAPAPRVPQQQAATAPHAQMHMQSSVFGGQAPPSARGCGGRGAASADLLAGPSDTQKAQAEAQRRQLVADLDAQVASRKAAASAKRLEEAAAEARAERKYLQALEDERAAMTRRPPSPDSPTALTQRTHAPWEEPPASPTHRRELPMLPQTSAPPPQQQQRLSQPGDDAPGAGGAEALAMLRFMRGEQLRMRDDFLAMQAEARATQAERDALRERLALAEAPSGSRRFPEVGQSFDGGFLVDSALVPLDAVLEAGTQGVYRTQGLSKQQLGARAAAPPRRTAAPVASRRAPPPAEPRKPVRGGWPPPKTAPPSVLRRLAVER